MANIRLNIQIKSVSDLVTFIVNKEKFKFEISSICGNFDHYSAIALYGMSFKKSEVIEGLQSAIEKIGVEKAIKRLSDLQTYQCYNFIYEPQREDEYDEEIKRPSYYDMQYGNFNS